MKNTAISWTDHTLKVFGKRLFGSVPEWGPGKPRRERLPAARKEALALNKEASKCRVIDGQVWIYTGSGQIIGEPETYRVSAAPQAIKLKGRKAEDYREFTRAEWETAPHWRPRVFVNSMSDWLDAEVPIEWLAQLLETLFLCRNLDFQLLTKRPENWASRMKAAAKLIFLPQEKYDGFTGDFANWFNDWDPSLHDIGPSDSPIPPANVWIGTTVENQEWADKRLPHLLRIPAKVRFLSCEPLLGPVDLANMEYFTVKLGKYPFNLPPEHRSSVFAGLHWVIAGGESGGKARPSHPDWFRSLRDQCAAVGVPFHFKQWGEFLPAGSEAAHLPADKTFKSQWMPGPTLPNHETGEAMKTQTLMLRPGTALAGHLLDGIAHQAFPYTEH
jgi:protein gp37